MSHSLKSERTHRSKQKDACSSRACREVLRLWRGFDEEALRMDVPQVTTPQEWIPILTKRFKIDARKDREQLLYVWNQVMDPDVLSHSEPENIARGTLFVHVENSVWLAELTRFHKEEMVKRLQSCLGGGVVKKICFKL